MMSSDVAKIRRRVLTEVAQLAFAGKLQQEINSLPRRLIDAGFTTKRCCQYHEKAVLKDLITLAIGVSPETVDPEATLAEILTDSQSLQPAGDHLVSILKSACDACPIDRIVVTDACRNCAAHSCVNACPKDAIEIVNNRAFVNRERCVECGLCVKSCHFGAIIELERPCTRACAVSAIGPDEEGANVIDHGKCVECGACISACPFGAIAVRSDLLKVINMLKAKQTQVVGFIAPSYVGQFGPLVEWAALEAGLKKLGFSAVVPVAAGADIIIELEALELVQKDGFLMNSCCPAFKNLVQRYFPEIASHISHTASPMIEIVKNIRKQSAHQTLKCIFIGPCVAKKGEALREGKSIVDAVLTFEELAVILVAAGINLAEIEVPSIGTTVRPSTAARKFCVAGGVKQAITERYQQMTGQQLKTAAAAGLKECRKLLTLLAAGKIEADFVEGMGCEAGCIGGPGTLVDAKRAHSVLSRLIK